jgi:hypothetical protein
MSQNKIPPISSVFSGIINKGSKRNFFSNGNIGIPIKITLDINIGGTSEKIPLTSSLLYIPPEEPSLNLLQPITQNPGEKTTPVPAINLPIIPDIQLEAYPRIPMRNERLPAAQLKQLRYKEVVQFFFNKNKFAEYMEKWGKGKLPILYSALEYVSSIVDVEDEKKEIMEDLQNPKYVLSERQEENIQIEKENIELMLHLLFPTYAFHSEGYKTSMQYWNPNEPYLTNFFPKTRISYIRHNGKIYTITNAVWLNDVFNVPFYRELIKYYEIYKDWKTERIHYLENEKEKIKEKMKTEPKPTTTTDRKPQSPLEKEYNIIEQVILLLKKNLMEKKELDDLFNTNSSSKYYEVRRKYLVITPSSQTKNQLYIYNILLSDFKTHTLSYNNEYLNDIIYSLSTTNKNKDKLNKNLPPENIQKKIKDKQLLEQMLENILDYAIHNGSISYLARGICSKENKSCHSAKEISTFYYTGIEYHPTSRFEEPSYEIYVLMDVIEGEVSKKNLAGIKCSYENQSIGKKLEFLTKQWPIWDLSNRRIFMRLDAKGETPLVSKAITETSSNVSISANEQEEKRNIYEDIQKRMEKWAEFDKRRTEHKLKNALEQLKTDTEKSSIDSQKYKKPNWSLNENGYIVDNDVFLKWLQNTDKYPSPESGQTNDAYVQIDRKIYMFLEKMEVLFQSNTEKTSKIRDIDNIVEQINNLIYSINRLKEVNESKFMSSQWNYVKIIMNFYAGLLSFLVNFLEDKKRKYQQEGADYRGGDSGERNMYALINKTMKKYAKLGRLTRKSGMR